MTLTLRPAYAGAGHDRREIDLGDPSGTALSSLPRHGGSWQVMTLTCDFHVLPLLAVLLRELEDGCPDALARARALVRGQLAALADGGEPRARAFIRARQAEAD
jgi:hypothetical protein